MVYFLRYKRPILWKRLNIQLIRYRQITNVCPPLSEIKHLKTLAERDSNAMVPLAIIQRSRDEKNDKKEREEK